MIVAGSPIVHPGPVCKTQFGIYLMRTRIRGNCMMISRKRQAFSRCQRMENLPRDFAPREVALFLDGQRKSCLDVFCIACGVGRGDVQDDRVPAGLQSGEGL